MQHIHEIRNEKGFLQWREGSGGIIELFEIEVKTEFRRQGVGRYLVEKLIKEVQGSFHSIYLFTRAENGSARLFYESLGFSRVAEIKDFYADGSKDAVMYLKVL